MKALLLILLASCVTPPRPIVGAATCADACNRGADLHCEWAKPTPRGTACADVCKLGIESEIFAFDLDCRANAPSCAEAETCEHRGTP